MKLDDLQQWRKFINFFLSIFTPNRTTNQQTFVRMIQVGIKKKKNYSKPPFSIKTNLLIHSKAPFSSFEMSDEANDFLTFLHFIYFFFSRSHTQILLFDIKFFFSIRFLLCFFFYVYILLILGKWQIICESKN